MPTKRRRSQSSYDVHTCADKCTDIQRFNSRNRVNSVRDVTAERLTDATLPRPSNLTEACSDDASDIGDWRVVVFSWHMLISIYPCSRGTTQAFPA